MRRRPGRSRVFARGLVRLLAKLLRVFAVMFAAFATPVPPPPPPPPDTTEPRGETDAQTSEEE